MSTAHPEQASTNHVPPRPRKKNRLWIWFFAFIVVASVGVAAFMIWFNLSIQLQPEELEARWKQWKAAGIRDYDLTYSKRLNENDEVELFAVTVRGGQVTDVVMNRTHHLEARERHYHSMDWWFRTIERDLEMDAKEGKRNFNVAVFNDETGALRKYVRRVMGSRQRVEVVFKLDVVKPAAPGS